MIESETCGNTIGVKGKVSVGAVYVGGSSGEYDRMMYCGRTIPSELITAMDTQAYMGGVAKDIKSQYSQDTAMCSFFAHADLLAFGSQNEGLRMGFNQTKSREVADGNRQSTLLICGRTDAFTCGQLVALSEHRAALKAKLFGINPFTTSCETGSAMRSSHIGRLSIKLHNLYEKGLEGDSFVDDEESNGISTKTNIATSTILSHYASRMQNQKRYHVK